MNDSQPELSDEQPVLNVTSNIRQGSPSPNPPSPEHHKFSLLSHMRTTIPVDPIYALPPPSRAPLFVFKSDEASVDDTDSIPPPDETSDTPLHLQTPAYDPSSPPPRIYFDDSDITFVPPVSYDFLERDPSVKGVPRNYRAWMRTGRPRLDVEGADRTEVKSDILAMGLTYPQDSESEEEGDEKERERKRKRRKKLAAKALMVPIERPRRMIRKIVDVDNLTPQPLPRKSIVKMKAEVVKPNAPPESVVRHAKVAKNDTILKIADKSDSSDRRSSSTLLDTDTSETARKRKRTETDNDAKEALPAEKRRISQRLHNHISPPSLEREASPSSAPETELSPPSRPESTLSDSLPVPEPAPAVETPKTTHAHTPGHRRPTFGPSRLPPRGTAGDASSSRTDATSSSRLTQLPASRPGHRITREGVSSLPRPIAMRTFPAFVPIIPGYSGFYQRYPVITQFDRDEPAGRYIMPDGDSQPKRSLGNWNAPRDLRDLYTPRYTKGSGNKKIALCPLCYEDLPRGGEGRQEWNHTKTSQHNYHMQYYHGISATRCAPFSPPTDIRTIAVPRPQSNEKADLLQGKCHNCKQWIALEGCKIGELKVKELFWWKHAAGCHKESVINGETDIFIEDDVYRRLEEYEAANSSQE